MDSRDYEFSADQGLWRKAPDWCIKIWQLYKWYARRIFPASYEDKIIVFNQLFLVPCLDRLRIFRILNTLKFQVVYFLQKQQILRPSSILFYLFKSSSYFYIFIKWCSFSLVFIIDNYFISHVITCTCKNSNLFCNCNETIIIIMICAERNTIIPQCIVATATIISNCLLNIHIITVSCTKN